MTRQRMDITPREAAALSRLLDAYISPEDDDPGRDDLRRVQERVDRLLHDHSAYDTPTTA